MWTCKLKNPLVKNASTNWTVIPHKKIVGNHIGSLAGRNNSPNQENGTIENFLLCVDPNLILPTQDVFGPSSARKHSTRALYGKGMKLISDASSTNNMIISKENQGDISVPSLADLVDQEEKDSPTPLNRKVCS
ncbi:hypothetical protein H5410_036985 [Solanum commersonii]|uniref:Uncharacterized protein n=1 Tax=Solanum commersonii TaxID=4109 RepID=A0A9J5Y5V3_SOLCO|nr:hypothetical protein H5410_036985 [Solanum commersonii]